MGGLLFWSSASLSAAQDITIYEVTWTAAPGCELGVESGVDVFVDARGPSPGDILFMGQVTGCFPELGPFNYSSVACDNEDDMLGTVTAFHREDGSNADTVEFTMAPCETGGQTYTGEGGTGGSGGTGGDDGTGGVGGSAGTGGTGGTGGGSGVDAEDGCNCRVHGLGQGAFNLGMALLVLGVLVWRRSRKRRR